MASETKATILQQHSANAHLTLTAPGLMMQGAHDLAADEARAQLDERMIATAGKALDDGQTHYVDVPGIGPLREAVAEHLEQGGAHYAQAHVIVTAGVQEARFLTIQKMSEDFDNQLAVPGVVHPGVAQALGMRARTLTRIPVDVAQSALPTVDAIREAMNTGAKLVYLESPSRLTGEAYSADAVAAIAALLQEHDATAIWDQGLAVWVPSGNYTALAAHDDATRVATIGEAWPGMGLASWFIGYIAAPERFIAPMRSQKQIMAICTSTPSQYAALEASKLYAEQHPAQVAQLGAIRQQMLEAASAAGLTPINGDAAHIVALRAPDAAATLAKLQAAGYRVAEGSSFRAPGILRLNVTPAAVQALQGL